MKYNQPYGITDPNAAYINGNPATGTMGSIPPAASIEYPQREIVNLIADVGIAPTNADMQQLAKGVQTGKLNFGTDIGIVNALIVPLVPIPDAYSDGMVVKFRAKFAPTAATTLDAGRGARAIVKSGGAPMSGSEWIIGDIITVIYDAVTSHWQLPPSPVPMLYRNADYYVSNAGSDSNDGLTAGTPFLTLQKAQNTINKYNLNGWNVTVHVADGTYNAVSGGQINGSGTITYQGNPLNPSACTITNNAGACFHAGGAAYILDGFRVTATGHLPGAVGAGLYCTSGGTIYHKNMDFGYCIDQHMCVDGGGNIMIAGPYKITGNAGTHLWSVNGSYIQGDVIPTPINIPVPVSIGIFAGCAQGSSMAVSLTITGAGNVTGQRYFAASNGVIATGGGGPNYYPGTIAGAVQTGGQYV
jgi:hypothetical protein